MMKKLLFAIIATMLLVPAVLAISENSRAKEPLEKITFIHYKDGTVKTSGGTANGLTCYKLMGVKWKSFPVNYLINPSNSRLDSNFVCNAVTTSAETWDVATKSKELFQNYNNCPIDLSATYGNQNYKNEISFGNYPTTGVIAITTVWYYPSTKAIAEFDIMFDTDWTWGDAKVNPAVMDLQNIATHELGHAVGLSDIYQSSCKTVTMYGYSNYGEIQKRTLEQPDITGLQKLYGA